MAWTVTFGGLVDGRFTLTASDGKTTHVRELSLGPVDDATVRACARAFVAELVAHRAAAKQLTLQAGRLVDLTPDPVVAAVVPDDDPDKAVFLANYRRLLGIKRAIDVGVLLKDKTYKDLVAKVTVQYLPSYEGLL